MYTLFTKVKEEIGRYRLFAVVNHMGTTDSGHYINYVLHAGEQWFRCDDTYLTKYVGFTHFLGLTTSEKNLFCLFLKS